MAWEINGTDEFAEWLGRLDEPEQNEVIAVPEAERLYERYLTEIDDVDASEIG